MAKTKTTNTTIDFNSVIEALEKTRKSKVIVYMTGDKKPEQLFSTKVAPDVIPYFRKVLRDIGSTEKITLAIYTNGGLLDTPWPLVNLIREHCNQFEVVILDKALSAGTMISLGADKIVMDKYAHLSPIDPAADIPDGNNQPKHFEIEDIIGYIDFVKEKIGITEQNALCDIMKDLTKEIPPTMLGSANRTHSLVRRLAKNLLGLHKKPLPERSVREIIEHLTQKLFSHRHLINRNEAKQIGMDELIEIPSTTAEATIENLRDFYVNYMEIETDFDPIKLLGADTKKDITINRAVVHSKGLKFTLQSNCQINSTPDPAGNPQMNVNLTSIKWNKVI